jgi:hypothetical protein
MKKCLMILLAAVLLLGTVPFGMGQTIAEPSAGKLKEGLYEGENGWLYLFGEDLGSGILLSKEAGSFYGVAWTEDSLTIAGNPVEFKTDGTGIEFAIGKLNFVLKADPERELKAGAVENEKALNLTGTFVAADGTIVRFAENGAGEIADNSGLKSFTWGFLDDGQDGIQYMITDSYMSLVELNHKLLRLRTDDNTVYQVSDAVIPDVEGQRLVNEGYNLSVILADENWTVEDREDDIVFRAPDGSAAITLSSTAVENDTVVFSAIDEALKAMMDEVSGKTATLEKECYDFPVAGMPGRSLVFSQKDESGATIYRLLAIFVGEKNVYYLSASEADGLSENTVTLVNSMIGSFRFAQ